MYRLKHQEPIQVGKKPAVLETWAQGKHVQVGQGLRYVIRAGAKGTGRILAKTACKFYEPDQRAAIARLKKKVHFTHVD